MAVKVTLLNSSNSSELFKDGQVFPTSSTGKLEVLTAECKLLAIYAAGTWANVRLVTE